MSKSGHGEPYQIYGHTAKTNSTDASETFPLYMFITGTTCHFNTESDQDTTLRMANLGYTAAQVEYENKFYPAKCTDFYAKAEPIFDKAYVQGALTVLCARKDTDCSKGIAVHGFSQGSQLASLASYYDDRVTAMYLQGHGMSAADGYDLTECMAFGSKYRTLPKNKVRTENGGPY